MVTLSQESRRWGNSGGFFHRVGDHLNYKAFTNDSLAMMYEGVRGALAADDALKRRELETRFRVRETSDWRKHAADLEAENAQAGNVLRSHRLVGRSGAASIRVTRS